MKVLLIYVPFLYGKKPLFGLNPLGIQYIARYLNTHGHSAFALDAEIGGLTIDDIIDYIEEIDPEIIGLSTMTMSYLSSLKLSSAIKAKFKDKIIVLGGPHVSSVYAEVLEDSELIDYAIYGEGEEAMLGLVEALSGRGKLEAVPNLLWRHNGKIRLNSSKSIDDLDGLPYPLIEDIVNVDIEKYPYQVPYASYKPISIIASRGCPYSCTFCCAHNIHGRRVRYRSVENILAEIEDKIKRYNTRYIIFKDSTFTLNREWVSGICRGIIDRGLKIRWRCNTRVDVLDNELLNLMKRSGCEMIQFGIESASPRVLKTLKKGFTIEQALKTLRLVKKHHIYAHLSFMIGNPGETEQDIANILPFLMKTKPEFMRVFVTTYYPGTELYEQNKDQLPDAKWYLREQYETNERYLFPDVELGTLPTNFSKNNNIRRIYRGYYFNPLIAVHYLLLILKNPVFVSHFLKVLLKMIKYVVRGK